MLTDKPAVVAAPSHRQHHLTPFPLPQPQTWVHKEGAKWESVTQGQEWCSRVGGGKNSHGRDTYKLQNPIKSHMYFFSLLPLPSQSLQVIAAEKFSIPKCATPPMRITQTFK